MEIAYLLIKTVHGKLKIVSSKLKTYEEIDEIHEVYGRYDIVIKILVESKKELKRFIQNKLFIIEGIAHMESLLVFDDD